MFRIAPSLLINPHLRSAYALIGSLRVVGGDPAKVDQLFSIILNSKLVEQFSEKHLSLSLALVLSPGLAGNANVGLAAESLAKRLLGTDLSLQGCNQILGALAKRKSSPISIQFAQTVFDRFVSDFAPNAPSRELSNVFWAAMVLRLSGAVPMLAARHSAGLAALLKEMDCVDLSLVCAGLMDSPDEPIWVDVRAELLSRPTFTPKDVPSIFCSLACAGINDRELILHLANVIQRDALMNSRNCPAILWALATCDSIHPGLVEDAVQLINSHNRIRDPLDVRRVSRAFAVWGKLGLIERWLLERVLLKENGTALSDGLLVWEFATNGLFASAVKFFRSNTLDAWKAQAASDPNIASQLYHLYLASLLQKSPGLSLAESDWLLSLQGAFSSISENMLSSQLHVQASDALNRLDISHVSEFREPLTGYVIDVFVPSLKLGIEVQGPTHFITDLETGSSILRPADSFKHTLLKKIAGIPILQLTPWNFGRRIRGCHSAQLQKLLDRHLAKT